LGSAKPIDQCVVCATKPKERKSVGFAVAKTYCISIFIGNTYAQSEKRRLFKLTQGTAALACGGHFPLDVVQAAKEGPRAGGGGAGPPTMRQAALDRLEWQITRLRADLEKAARFADEGAAILDELAGVSFRNGL